MRSKLITACELMKTARKLLDGNDFENEKLREVLDLTIEAFVLADRSRESYWWTNVVRLPVPDERKPRPVQGRDE